MSEDRIRYQDYDPDIRRIDRIVYVSNQDDEENNNEQQIRRRNIRRNSMLILIFLLLSCLVLLVSYLLTNWDDLTQVS